MTVTRLNTYRPCSVADAEIGFNVSGTVSKAAFEKLAASGATYVRWQPGWSSVENFTTGALALSATDKTWLGYCAEMGLKPVLIAAYGPPYSNVFNLTAKESVAIGQRTIPISAVSGGHTLADLEFWKDFTYWKGQEFGLVANGRWAYYGAAIQSADVAGGTITLGSKTIAKVEPGDTFQVQRLRYSPLYDSSKTNPSVVAYARYALFLAEEIAAAGLKGHVCLWNEDEWSHDLWNHGAAFFEVATRPEGMIFTQRGKSQLEACLDQTLPTGVTYINGMSDKTGGSGLYAQSLAPTTDQVQNVLSHEGMHDYGANPEQFLWDPSSTESAAKYQIVNPVDAAANFQQMAKSEVGGGVGLKLSTTECGLITEDDTRQAVYLLRRVASHFGIAVPSIIFQLTAADGYKVLTGAGLEPRASYTALKRLMGLVGKLGVVGGTKCAVPSLIGCADHIWPLMTSGVYGSGGGLLLAWQRTYENGGVKWAETPTPATYSADFYLPVGFKVAEAINCRTGEAVETSLSGRRLTVQAIGEDVVAVRTEPS